MSRYLALASVVALATTALLPTAPAQAAVSCAPDAYEIDDNIPQNAAPIVDGQTVHRAICLERDPLPGKPFSHDIDLFEFTAVEGQAYTAQVVDVGSGLLNDAGAGGLSIGISGADSSPEQTFSQDGDLVVTAPLHAGTYRIVAATMDQQAYPEDNVLGTRTVQGDAGKYGVRLFASAPAPVLAGLSISPNPVNGGKDATATLTFSSPAPANGLVVNLSSNNAFVAGNAGSSIVPPGATRFTMRIRTGRVASDTRVTFTGLVAHVGPSLTTDLIVRR